MKGRVTMTITTTCKLITKNVLIMNFKLLLLSIFFGNFLCFFYNLYNFWASIDLQKTTLVQSVHVYAYVTLESLGLFRVGF